MSNIGAYPVDTSTPVGALRSDLGDTEGTPIPVEGGNPTTADYKFFSDADLARIISESFDNPARARAYGYAQLSAAFSTQSLLAKTYDLQVDLRQRASDFRNLAEFWSGQADKSDDLSGVDEDIFFADNDLDSNVNPWPEALPAQSRLGGRIVL